MTSRRVTAVLLAGGIGARVGGEIPKQLLEVAGRPLLAHALAAFEAHPRVDDVLIVMAPGFEAAAESIATGSAKVRDVLTGGATRSDSTLVALARLEADGLVLFHDAARPLVTARMVDDCLDALGDHDAVSTVVPTADTIWQVAEDGSLAGIPARSSLRRVQTPQGFRVGALAAAYDVARRDPAFEATDDAAVVFRYTPQVRVALVPGDERNLKVTVPSDLALVERLLAD